jgi:two-component system, sensor histidine kinase and response regulator
MVVFFLLFILQSAPDKAAVDAINIASSKLKESDLDSAFMYANSALQAAEAIAYEEGKIDAHNNLAWVHYRRNDYAQSLTHAHQAFILSDDIDYYRGLANAYFTIAANYFDLDQNENARHYASRGLRASEQAGELELTAKMLHGLSVSLYGLNRLDSAELLANRCIQLNERIQNKIMQAFAHRTLGDIYVARGEFDRAHQAFSLSHKMGEAEDNNYLLASIGYRLAQVELQTNRLDQAIINLNESRSLSEKHGFQDELYFTYLQLKQYFEKKNDFKAAYEYANLAHRAGEALNHQLTLLQSKLALEHSRHEIQLLRQESRLKQEQLRERSIWLTLSGFAVAMISGLAVLLLRRNKQIFKTNRLLRTNEAKLEAININKDKLMAIMSHDMRSPIQSLKGLTQVMAAGLLKPEEVTGLGKTIGTRLALVDETLTAVLNWSTAHRSGIITNPEQLQLDHVLQELLMLYRDLAHAKNIQLMITLEPAAAVFADRDQVQIIIRNLLSNAIKFTPLNGSIHVSTQTGMHTTDITVRDTGVGMDEDTVSLIHAQGSPPSNPGTQQERGVGLGLHLCHEFLALNHGTLLVTSEPNKGSAFTVRLPNSKSHPVD